MRNAGGDSQCKGKLKGERMRMSPLIKVWDGDKLVDLFIAQDSAADTPPNPFERELVRIFAEHREMLKILQSIPEKFLTSAEKKVE